MWKFPLNNMGYWQIVKRYRISIEYYEKLMNDEKMQRLPLNSIENWQKTDKNVEFPLNNMEN